MTEVIFYIATYKNSYFKLKPCEGSTMRFFKNMYPTHFEDEKATTQCLMFHLSLLREQTLDIFYTTHINFGGSVFMKMSRKSPKANDLLCSMIMILKKCWSQV